MKDKVNVSVTSEYKWAGMGMDDGLEKATVMLFDNGKNVPLNTTFKVHTVLNQPIPFYRFSKNPFNPFIVVSGYALGGFMDEGRKEVHLPANYGPTAKANLELFGTADDKSADNKYYVGSGNYPFAIELLLKPEDQKNFGIPTEGEPIDVTYPRFINWVKSNGREDKDWYVKK